MSLHSSPSSVSLMKIDCLRCTRKCFSTNLRACSSKSSQKYQNESWLTYLLHNCGESFRLTKNEKVQIMKPQQSKYEFCVRPLICKFSQNKDYKFLRIPKLKRNLLQVSNRYDIVDSTEYNFYCGNRDE